MGQPALLPAGAESPALRCAACAVAGAYPAIAARFWFRGPAIGAGLSLLLLAAAALLTRIRP